MMCSWYDRCQSSIPHFLFEKRLMVETSMGKGLFVEDAVPYKNLGQNATPVLRADCHKIRPCIIIKLRQANGFSFRIFHANHLVCIGWYHKSLMTSAIRDEQVLTSAKKTGVLEHRWMYANIFWTSTNIYKQKWRDFVGLPIFFDKLEFNCLFSLIWWIPRFQKQSLLS